MIDLSMYLKCTQQKEINAIFYAIYSDITYKDVIYVAIRSQFQVFL